MELDPERLVRSRDILDYDPKDAALGLRARRGALWLRNDVMSLGIKLERDGRAYYIGLADRSPESRARGVNIFTPHPSTGALWDDRLKPYRITWEVRAVSPPQTSDERHRGKDEHAEKKNGHRDAKAAAGDPARKAMVYEGELVFHLTLRKPRDIMTDEEWAEANPLMLYRLKMYTDYPFVAIQSDFPKPHVTEAVGARAGVAWETRQGLTLPLRAGHYHLHAVKLLNHTDTHDNPFHCANYDLNPRIGEEAEGEIFVFEDTGQGVQFLCVREAMPVRDLQRAWNLRRTTSLVWMPGDPRVEDEALRHPQLRLIGRTVNLKDPDYIYGDRFVMGLGKQHLVGAYRNLLRWELLRDGRHGFDLSQSHRLTMVPDSIWDPKRVRRRDIRAAQEQIEAAAALGADAVILDAKTVLADPETLGDLAREQGIELRLRYRPGVEPDEAAWRVESEMLLELKREHGIQNYDFVGMDLSNEPIYGCYTAFLSRLMEGGIHFSQNVRGPRSPWLTDKPSWGALRLEHRETSDGTYYPHATLRKLWQLAHVMPAERLELELKHPRQDAARYPARDTLAPTHYDMDYLFFSISPASILLDEDLKDLEAKDRQDLDEALAIYRKVRPALRKLRVQPVGDRPDGHSITGFAFMDWADEIRYLLVLKEDREDGRFRWELPGLVQNFRIRYLAHNTPHRPMLEVAYKAEDNDDMAFVSGNLGVEAFRYTFFIFDPMD